MVEKIYNLVEILDRDVVKNGDGVTPFQFKLSYSDGKTVDLKDKRVYVSFASTTTYLFKKKAEVDSEGTISITLNDADPIIEGNTEIEISVESSNGKSQKFPSQDGEHSAFVYISKSIESLNSRLINTYTLKQFSDKIDILMDDLDKKYDDHLDNLKKDVGDYIDNSVEDKVDEIKDVAKESMNASIKASEDSIAASLTAENNVKATSTKAVADINSTATKATTDINKVATDATKNITDTSNAAVATVNAKGDAVLKTFAENGQVPKITADTGAPRYDLNSTKDLFSEISTWGNGFFTFYLSAGATNNPTGTKSWLRGRASTYGKNSDVLAYDKDGTMYIVVCANGIWGSWDKTAMSSKTQNSKITNDDGSSITVSGYDLLDVEDVKNYDGYVTNPKNSPSSGGSGYFKRKYRDGYIEITFAPHSQKSVYRNAYNFSTKLWIGWEKMVTSSELASVIGSNTGWLPLPLLNGVTASTPCFYRFHSTNGIYYLSFKGVLNTLSTRDVIIAKLPAEVTTKIDRPLTFVGNTSVSANTARFNRWVVEMDGTIKFAISNFGTDGESGSWNPLDVTLTL